MTDRFCCDGRCEQGRVCPALAPAEDDDNIGYWTQRICDAFAIIGLVAAIAFVVGLLV